MRDDLNGGKDWFTVNLDLPDGQALRRARFTSPYLVRTSSQGQWNVTAQLETIDPSYEQTMVASVNQTIETVRANAQSAISTVQTYAQEAIEAMRTQETDTTAGLVELATNEEIAAGTDTTRAITPAGFKTVTSQNFVPHIDLMAIWSTAELNGKLHRYPDGGAVTY